MIENSRAWPLNRLGISVPRLFELTKNVPLQLAQFLEIYHELCPSWPVREDMDGDIVPLRSYLTNNKN
jgi:hypothetical protein